MWLTLATLFGIGLQHGLGPDHCLAIGALSARGGGRGGGFRGALGVSLRFGLSHTVVLAACALAALVFGVTVPARWEAALEVVAGVVLLGIGGLSVFSARVLVVHRHVHAHGGVGHVHLHAHAEDGEHGHEAHATLPAVLGAVFGLSGVRSLVLLLPMVLGRRVGWMLAGVVVFGAGVVVAMLAVGWLTQRVAGAGRSVERVLRVGVGVASMLVGAYWIVAHVG